jgi:hypothetical protein
LYSPEYQAVAEYPKCHFDPDLSGEKSYNVNNNNIPTFRDGFLEILDKKLEHPRKSGISNQH